MKANDFLFEKVRALEKDGARPNLHFTPLFGWLNDPNGLIYYNGMYHLFYQYNPFKNQWGNIHWGHAISRDLQSWNDMPVALEPSESYDKDGVFSGSAIVKDDQLYVLYTGHSVDAKGQAHETQCLAYSKDGVTFQKYDQNPVIDLDTIPGIEPENFRDPKVIQRDGKYYLFLAAGIQKHGNIILFESDDLRNWTYKGNIFKDFSKLGVMTECPDFFSIDGRDFLTFCVIWGESKRSQVYLAEGKMDWDQAEFTCDKFMALDGNADIYATQSFNYEGSRVLISWFRSMENETYLVDTNHQWNGMMTIPRYLELAEDGKKVIQKPFGVFKTEKIKAIQSIKNQTPRIQGIFELGSQYLFQGKDGEVKIKRINDENEYVITVHSPAFKKEYHWQADSKELSLIFDNSTLEIFAKEKTFSIVTLIQGRECER